MMSLIVLKDQSDNDFPYIMVGDFNEMLHSTKKDGGRQTVQFVSSCEMLDVKAKGCFFTWRNGHYEDFIQERLYLVLVNAAALGEFSDLEVFVPPTTGSDHNMLDLSLDARNFFGHKLFKNEVAWQEEQGYEDVVVDGWAEVSEVRI